MARFAGRIYISQRPERRRALLTSADAAARRPRARDQSPADFGSVAMPTGRRVAGRWRQAPPTAAAEADNVVNGDGGENGDRELLLMTRIDTRRTTGHNERQIMAVINGPR